MKKTENLRAHLKDHLARKQKELDNFDKPKYAHYFDFDEHLNTTTKWPCVLGIALNPSKALYNQDILAYNHAFKAWANSLSSEDFPEYQELLAQIAEIKDWLSSLDDGVEEV